MFFIVLAAVFYGVAILFGATASRHLDTNYAAFITNLISTLIPLAALLGIAATKKTQLSNSKFGIFAAVMCGITVAVYVMSINKAYSTDKVAIVAPIVLGGSLLISTIASYVVFKEKVTLLHGVGLGLLFVSLIVIGYAKVNGK